MVKSSGQDTKAALVDAGLRLIGTAGYADITARSLAEEANCNSALVFYHFGSVDEVLLAGLKKASEQRLARYKTALAKVDSPTAGLKAVKKLWQTDNAAADVGAIRELVANQAFTKNHREQVNAELAPWFAFVEAQVKAHAADNPILAFMKAKDIAFCLIAFAMGIETLQQISPNKQSVNALFGSAENIIKMIDTEE